MGMTMINKPLEFWAVVAGMSLWIFTSTSQNETLLRRFSKTIASGILAFGLSTDVANYLEVQEGFAAVAIMAFGLIALDTATALVSDRQFVKDILRRRFGGDK